MTSRSKRIQNLMDKEGLSHFYESRFSQFGVSPQLFADLVTCKVIRRAKNLLLYIERISV